MKHKDLCTFCEKDYVVLVEDLKDTDYSYLQCPSCDSTFNMD